MVENKGEINGKVEDDETLGSDHEWQDLYRVADQETIESRIVGHVVEEDERNDCVTGRDVRVDGEPGRVDVYCRFGVQCRADRLKSEEEDHAANTTETKLSSTDLVDEECECNRRGVVEDLEDTIDELLVELTGDSNGIENFGKVVRDQTVTGPLREKGKRDDDPHSFAVTWVGEKRCPGH